MKQIYSPEERKIQSLRKEKRKQGRDILKLAELSFLVFDKVTPYRC